eukprot:2622962-Pyramimonas_sp.AAC.1
MTAQGTRPPGITEDDLPLPERWINTGARPGLRPERDSDVKANVGSSSLANALKQLDQHAALRSLLDWLLYELNALFEQ